VINAQEVFMPQTFLKSNAFEVYQSAVAETASQGNITGNLQDGEIQFGCTFYKDLTFYDLTPLKIFGPRVINRTDPLSGAEIFLSFC
jgi:hypothetical protein